jgi:hypothetical protein
MNCVNKLTCWTIYDAREKRLYSLDHNEFKQILLDRPVKLVGRFIYIKKEKIWIDGLLNSDWLSKEIK